MTTTATAPDRPQTGIEALGGQLREAIDNGTPHASADYRLDSQQITLSRSGTSWALTITDAEPIAPHTAALWAAAVDAPSTDWWRTQQGRRWRTDWQERAR
jgi:hypothetical protein